MKFEKSARPSATWQRALKAIGILVAASALGGCVVATVAGTAVAVGAGAVGLAADAAIGTARVTGKAVGATANAVLPGDDKK